MSSTAATTQETPVDALARILECNQLKLSLPRTAGEIMTTEVKYYSLDDTIGTVRESMAALKIRHSIVFDSDNAEVTGQKNLVGVISQRDLLRVAPLSGTAIPQDVYDSKALRNLISLVITRDPRTVSPEKRLRETITLMVNQRIDLLPVIENEQVIGIITTTDILKLFMQYRIVIARLSHILRKSGETNAQGRPLWDYFETWIQKPVGGMMTRELVTASENETLMHARKVLRKNRFRHLVIVDENGQFAGILSDRDILKTLPFERKSPSPESSFRKELFKVDPGTPNLNIPLSDIMTQRKKVKYVAPEAPAHEAAKIMKDHKINSLPVLDDSGTIAGILTTTDMMLTLLTLFEPFE